jgi:O-methyltransferase
MDEPRPSPSPPAADPDEIRRAYLDLLKLTLCDLVAPETETVEMTEAGAVRRVLAGAELERRIAGREWPLQGLSMSGYPRLADLQECIETVIADGIPGDLIEAGVWRGGASILARATLDSLGATNRTVWLADSFEGLPPPDAEGFPEDRGMDLHTIDFLAVSQADVRANFARLGLDHGVRFVEGFFNETLPALRGRRWALIRLDADMYESTWQTLEALYPGLAQGGYVIFDDYGDIEEGRRAMDDFRRRRGIETPLEWVDHTCVRWRREEPPEELADEPAADPERERQSAIELRRPGLPLIKSEREVDLEHQIKLLRGRIAELETELRPLLGGVRARLRNLRRGG